MDSIPASDHELVSFRSTAGILTEKQQTQIIALSAANEVPCLDALLTELSAQHGTTKGVLLLRARDAVGGRNAVHHAAANHATDALEYLLDAALFPEQPALRLALLRTREIDAAGEGAVDVLAGKVEFEKEDVACLKEEPKEEEEDSDDEVDLEALDVVAETEEAIERSWGGREKVPDSVWREWKREMSWMVKERRRSRMRNKREGGEC